MRMLVDVNTINQSVDAIRAAAIRRVDEIIKKLSEPCVVCKQPFMPERRTRKKYCSDECRWKASNKTANKRYHIRKEKSQDELLKNVSIAINNKRLAREALG